MEKLYDKKKGATDSQISMCVNFGRFFMGELI